MRTVSNRECSIQMVVDDDAAARQCGAPALRLDLKGAVGPADGVVLTDHPFMLDGEDVIQILPSGWHKRGAAFGCGYGELLVELANVGFSEKNIGVDDVSNARQPKFLWQATLPGLKVAF